MFDTDNRNEEMERAAALHGLLGRIVDELDLTHDRTAPAELRVRAAILKIDDALMEIAEEISVTRSEEDVEMLVQLADTLEARKEARR